MYSAETTIVDVKQTGEEEYTLSMTAKELYVAAQSGDVLRRHDVSESDKAPEKKYVALSGVKFAEATGKYTFTFASGDVMEASSADAYPTSSSISDATGGGSGGGVMLVSVSAVQDGDDIIYTADKTAREIINAMPLVYTEDLISEGTVKTHVFTLFSDGSYSIHNGEYTFSYHSMELVAETLDDYPTHTETGK